MFWRFASFSINHWSLSVEQRRHYRTTTLQLVANKTIRQGQLHYTVQTQSLLLPASHPSIHQHLNANVMTVTHPSQYAPTREKSFAPSCRGLPGAYLVTMSLLLLHLPSLLFKFGTNCRTRQGWSRLILIFCSTHRRSDDDEDDDSPPHRSSCRDFGTDFV